jgi:hypothetical protein
MTVIEAYIKKWPGCDWPSRIIKAVYLAASSSQSERGLLGVAVMRAWDRAHPEQLSGTFLEPDSVIDLTASDGGMSFCSLRIHWGY